MILLMIIITGIIKTFTKNGMSFRPSSQIGSGRKKNQKEFEDYCNTQTFIIASVIKFPIVKQDS